MEGGDGADLKLLMKTDVKFVDLLDIAEQLRDLLARNIIKQFHLSLVTLDPKRHR